MKYKRQPEFWLILFVGLSATLIFSARLLRAQKPEQNELQAVWERVRQSGAYEFSAGIDQALTPQPTATSAGRKSKEYHYYLEGETNIAADLLHLTLWSNGGSALVPESGLEIKVEGQSAMARQSSGAWQEIDNFTGLFAPGGDFMAYGRAAENVVRHAPETRSTVLGDILVTRYTFDISGRLFAEQMQSQMVEQAMREGLPPGVRLELPRVYTEMSGQGEVWVDPDGLPLRQEFTLQFPPDPYNYVSTAELQVDFANFAPQSSGATPLQPRHRLDDWLATANSPSTAGSLLTIALALLLVWLLLKRSKTVYAAVVLTIILSMLATPLLTVRQLSAYSGRQADKQAAHDRQQAEIEASEAVSEQRAAAAFDPHTNPLTLARQESTAADALLTQAQDAAAGRYYDPSCENDPAGDEDGDGLTNLSECLLGTLTDAADSDNDGVTDSVEVEGFSYKGKTWYTDPTSADSNSDGIADGKEWHMSADGSALPDDTDNDGYPDLWDDDNDGDGVRDEIDMSPYAGGSESPTFSGDEPFELTIDNLVESELVSVEFQIRPTNSNHLWYSQSVLDWPVRDEQGQIQDVDGATFFDVDNTLNPWPNDNGDMRLLPMLEVTMPAASANLPPSETCTNDDGSTYTCYPILQQFGIVVQETSPDTLTAYVPVQLVNDSTGDGNVAFYARMYYQASASWGAAHEARLVWLVQVLNDICTAYDDDGSCSAYDNNQLQVVQTYDDEWYFTGMHVMEEHNADIALIYEDPQVTGSVAAGYDTPFYMDTLYGLLYGLDSSFLAGRDCDSTDANDNCVGNGQLDVTVNTIGDRFNRSTNSYDANDPAYWGLPNVLGVVKNGVQRTPNDQYGAYAAIPSYEALDLGMMDTTTTQTEKLLDAKFTPAWTASKPITPTIMLAFQQYFRDVNLDALVGGDPNLSWSGSSLTVNLPQSGSNAVPLSTMAGVKWTPYAYDPAAGWAAADIGAYYDDLTNNLGSAFSDITDPTEAQTQQDMAQFLYMTVYGGDNNIIQSDNVIISYDYQQPDTPIYLSLTGNIAKATSTVVGIYFTFDAKLAEIAESFPEEVGKSVLISEYLEQNILSKLTVFKGLAAATMGILFLALITADVLVNYIYHDANSPLGIGLNDTVHSVFILFSAGKIFSTVNKVIELATALTEIDESVTFSEALITTLSSSSSLLKASSMMSVVGLIIAIGLALGMFIYAWASGTVSPGTVAFNQLIAQTISAIVIALILFVLSFTVIGSILVSILALIDAILTLAGSNFTITGWFTNAIASVLYQYDLDTTQDVASGQIGLALAEPDRGMVAGNTITQTLPLTTTLKECPLKSSTDRLRGNSMAYSLSYSSADISTAINARSSGWDVSEDGTTCLSVSYGIPLNYPRYQAVVTDNLSIARPLSAGVNTSEPIILNSAYALYGESCWLGICSSKSVSGSSSDSLGDIVILDVLPATLDGLVDVHSWGTMTFLDADGDGMLPKSLGGLDPDDTKWDSDTDNLSDAYEVNINSLTIAQGGVSLDPLKADSDEDGLLDYAELRSGTDPGRQDSDGDGLLDIFETQLTYQNGKLVLNSDSGWLIPYAYNSSSQQTAETRVWSDPLRGDFDDDGMSDGFEKSQTTLDNNPWADPNNPLVFNPRVWNESPVALYVDDNSSDGYVLPGATVVYTTSTSNNLSSGQELVGELSLDLPAGVSGGPLSQVVDINGGESDALVSTLNFAGNTSADYVLSSSMSLTDFDETVWAWDPDDPATFPTQYGTANDVMVVPVTGWDAPFMMVTRESKPDSFFGVLDAIYVYLLDSNGSIVDSEQLQLVQGSTWTRPALACNDAGACIVAWGQSWSNKKGLWFMRLSGSLSNGSLTTGTDASPSAAISVASDGSDFMLSYFNGSDLYVEPVPAAGQAGQAVPAAAVSGSGLSTAIAWTGEYYALVWTEDGTMHRAAVDSSGAASSATSIGPGSGWPQTDVPDRAPALAYDAVSNRALLAYRDPSGSISSRILTDGSSGAAAELVNSGVDGSDVIVSLSADPKNSGWVVGWAVAGAGSVEYRAVSPTGALRGKATTVDRSALTAVSLSCNRPEPLLKLDLGEKAGATTFSDSSGNDLLVTCGADDTVQCPEAGYAGQTGNATSFDGQHTALIVPNGVDLANRSFTLSAWAKRENPTAGEINIILSQGPSVDPNDRLAFGFWSDSSFVCYFEDNYAQTTNTYSDSDWHHWVCTYDANTGQRLIYRDGVALPTSHVGSSSGNYVGSGPLYIGRLPVANWYFEGLLEDIAIYDRVLSATEIQDVFDRPSGVYDLDEASGSETFINAAQTGFNGECSGASCPTMGVPGVSYTAAQFDGMDDFIEIPAEPAVDTSFQWTFEDNNVSGWSLSSGSPASTAVAERNGAQTNYLPVVDSDHADLIVSDLPAHDTATVSYDLFVIGSSWRGSGMYDNEASSYRLSSGNQSLLETTFSNESNSEVGTYQLYPADARPWNDMTTAVFEGSNCSGQSYSWNGVHGITSYFNDTSSQAPFNANCASTNQDSVAFLYTGTGFGGSVFKQDPGRGVTQMPTNTPIKSIKLGPAAYHPQYGSTGDSLDVGGSTSNTVYSLQSSLPHGSDSIGFSFEGFSQQFGLDNVKVDLIKEANSFAFGDASFTLSAWAKRAAAGQNHIILSQGTNETNKGLSFGFRDNNTFTCAFWGDDLNTAAAYTDTDWHHWACTYDVLTKQRTIYRDGVQVAQDTAQANYSGLGPTYIGQYFLSGSNFNGIIDEVGIWNLALDATAVQELYQKVKVEDQSVLICQLPAGTSSNKLIISTPTLRETTTNIGAVSQGITRTITIDAEIPQASIDSAYFSQSAPGPYVSSAGTLVVAGSATDQTSYITWVEIIGQNQSSWHHANGTASWSYNWDIGSLEDGPYSLDLRARDVVGHLSNVTTWYTILDTAAPAIVINEPAGPVLPRQNEDGVWQTIISGTVQDPPAGGQPGSGVARVEVLLAGGAASQGANWQEAALNDDGSWQVEYNLPAVGGSKQAVADPSGVYMIAVRAADNIGNATPDNVPVTAGLTLDATPPVVTAGASLTGTQVISTSLTIGGLVSDSGTIQAVEINFTPAEQMDALTASNLYLPMNERAGTVYFHDQSGTNNDAACSAGSCPTAGITGQRDGAFDFDGGGDNLLVSPGVVQLSKADFTIAAWVKTTARGVGIVTKSNGNNKWEVGEKSFYLDDSGVPNFVGWGNSYIHGTTAVNDGQWHHVAVTWSFSSGTSGSGRIYVDGADDTASTTNYQDHNEDIEGDILRIGAANYGNEAPGFFNGAMDEFVVFQRALADYEVANLYSYASGAWESTAFANGSWSYAIPDGADGIEGLYQINVRGTDELGNVTPLGGQRVWRGEIDTKPPELAFHITDDPSGSTDSTLYECLATDFNLVEDTTCIPGSSPSIPTFRSSDMTLTTYAETDLWYANTFTDTARLYMIDALRTYTGGAVSGQTMTACDAYNNCGEIDPTALPPEALPAGAEVLDPSSGTAVSTAGPITISGDAYASRGLQALLVTINGSPAHAQLWAVGEAGESTWSFSWTPPGEGIYVIQPSVLDWGEAAAYRVYMPLLAVSGSADRRQSQGTGPGGSSARDLLTAGGQPETIDGTDGGFTGTPATIYVDLQPPQVSISPTTLGPAQRIGWNILQLAGNASDSVLLHRVDVSIDGGSWQRAGLVGDDRWQLYWTLPGLPAMTADQTFQISVRATDVAGRTTAVTKEVVVKAP